MKKCTKCGELKSKNDFYKTDGSHKNKDGLRSHCKACNYLEHKEYSEKNRIKLREYSRKFYQENRYKKLAQKKAYQIKNKDRIANRKHAWYLKNKDEILKKGIWNHIKHRYNISQAEFESMLMSQENKCLICKQMKRLVVDHNHKTKENRGLLCFGCNNVLGLFNDEVQLFKSAIAYIKKYERRESESTASKG